MQVKRFIINFIIVAIVLIMPAAVLADNPLPAWYTTNSVSRDFKEDFEGIMKIHDTQSPQTIRQRLRESMEEWERQKRARGDSYTYTRGFESWVGFGHETTITVNDGVIVERGYKEWDKHDQTTGSYTEKGNDIGRNRHGETPMTMEELYDLCAEEILTQNPKDNYLNLELTADGLLQSCTYRPKGCVDDCSEGITGFTLTWNN